MNATRSMFHVVLILLQTWEGPDKPRMFGKPCNYCCPFISSNAQVLCDGQWSFWFWNNILQVMDNRMLIVMKRNLFLYWFSRYYIEYRDQTCQTRCNFLMMPVWYTSVALTWRVFSILWILKKVIPWGRPMFSSPRI